MALQYGGSYNSNDRFLVIRLVDVPPQSFTGCAPKVLSERLNTVWAALDKLNVYEEFPLGIWFLHQRVDWLRRLSSSLFFLQSTIKTLSVICDPFLPSSWEGRLELLLNAVVFFPFFSFSIFFLNISTSLWPWRKRVTRSGNRAAGKLWVGERHAGESCNNPAKRKLGIYCNEVTAVWADTWIESHL